MARATNQFCTAASAARLRTDVHVIGSELYLLPVQTRVPLKFGAETLTSVTCARVRLKVRDRIGRSAFGWGETPLNVQWAWPSELSMSERRESMVRFCKELALAWASFGATGHPLEVGNSFAQQILPELREQFNENRQPAHRLPHLAALVCLSAFDIALHDAFGVLHDVHIYETYQREWMSHDLSWFLEPATGTDVDFHDRYPSEFLVRPATPRLPSWHLVGGLDLVTRGEANGHDSPDSLPLSLDDWIERDGLFCLKIKLRGNDAAWDYDRLVRVGREALQRDVRYLSADFNCTVTAPSYVNEMLDRLAADEPEIDRLLLYIEQPFSYELDDQPFDVRSVAARKPLFMDESAHSWRQIRLGRALGWTGVALKTCKTQTEALLSLCWAKAHGMSVMVQDLTNPMLAQVPHVLLAAHAGTIMGVETNAMQFYPQASAMESAFHPGLYVRSAGHVDLSTVVGAGFGYAGAENARELPPTAASYGIRET
jgi:L-alanine-DL-glutamate epimerase-like enolase superfamily enzyme